MAPTKPCKSPPLKRRFLLRSRPASSGPVRDTRTEVCGGGTHRRHLGFTRDPRCSLEIRPCWLHSLSWKFTFLKGKRSQNGCACHLVEAQQLFYQMAIRHLLSTNKETGGLDVRNHKAQRGGTRSMHTRRDKMSRNKTTNTFLKLQIRKILNASPSGGGAQTKSLLEGVPADGPPPSLRTHAQYPATRSHRPRQTQKLPGKLQPGFEAKARLFPMAASSYPFPHGRITGLQLAKRGCRTHGVQEMYIFSLLLPSIDTFFKPRTPTRSAKMSHRSRRGDRQGASVCECDHRRPDSPRALPHAKTLILTSRRKYYA